MNKVLRNKAFLVAAVASGSFLAGAWFERKRFVHNVNKLADSNPYVLHQKNEILQTVQIKNKPALPLFGTVSAAVPFSQDENFKTSRVSEIMKYGFPGLANVRSFSDFILSYDSRNRVAHWVFEHLTHESIKFNESTDRSICTFKPDESIHPYFRSDNSDYKNSGYDRGHLAAAGNHKRNQNLVDETFHLSNIAPQVGKGFNRDTWNRLERYVRKLTKKYPHVYVCTGPLYLPKKEADGKKYVKYEVIGTNNVAVPTHFYKVVVVENIDSQFEMEAYVMPNEIISDDVPLDVFRVPPEAVERASGLLFFDRISKSQLKKVNGKKL